MFSLLASLLISSAYASPILYVTSGACYAGGQQTTSAPANLITKFDAVTGANLGVIADYNGFFGDSPVGMDNWDSENLLVAVDNSAGRRIDMVRKDGTGTSTYLVNSTALSGVLRSLTVLPNHSILVSKSYSVEKFNANKSRVMNGNNPFINSPAAACSGSNTLISSVTTNSIGQILVAHAGARPNNRVFAVSANGYVNSSDCLSSASPLDVASMPVAVAWHPAGDLLVAYGSVITGANMIVSYRFDFDTGLIHDGVVAWSDADRIGAPTAMTVDAETGEVFVANGSLVFNSIEKFYYNTIDRSLQPLTEFAFLPSTIYTRCVSSMVASD